MYIDSYKSIALCLSRKLKDDSPDLDDFFFGIRKNPKEKHEFIEISISHTFSSTQKIDSGNL